MKLITRHVPSKSVDPFADFFGLYPGFERVFSGPRASGSYQAADWRPAIDLKEDEKAYVVSVDLPGIKKDDLSLTVDEGRLVLKGERTKVEVEDGEQLHRSERVSGSFYRSFDLGDEVDLAGTQADFSDGVLTVRVPKAVAPEPEEVRIAIN